MSHIPFTQARANLAELIQQSQHGNKTFISQRGHTSAVLLSLSDYNKLNGTPQNFMQAWATWHQNNLQVLQEDITDFQPGRDDTQGREFSW
ncbi:hypothetical protein GCM10023206_16080 [Acinetobacter puyangensis]|uniref:Antitoxin n=1 Tax=Acinetobacter puyangensis TaxID=1096779 RepID=A0A240E7G2_9GAMM|nr:type II toxin-antitoxin system Phd/YefM family antitoxin [Acinetobacter puyangensis]SNX44674.1 prevent-host-death family protein [Acinetobacter puyangensis]